MPYASSTPNYKIPWQNQGEAPSAASNQRAAYIIDNQTRAAIAFFGNLGIIEEGTYVTNFISGNSSVVLQANAKADAITGIINNAFVDQTITLSFTEIPDNTKVYLYVLAKEENVYSSTQFSTLQSGLVKPYFNTTGITPVNSLFLGTATTTSSGITLDVRPTAIDNGSFSSGKVYITDFQEHRTQIPLDHPDNCITQSKLQQQSVLSKTIAVYDGFTSGTSALSGTGISSSHIKPNAVHSRHLESNLFVSGLTITDTLSTSSNSKVSFSGITTYNRIPSEPLELVNLKTLDNVLLGTLTAFGNNFIVGKISLLSGVNSTSIIYPEPLPTIPRYIGVTPEINGIQTPFTFRYITSGTNAGCIAVFSGVTLDTSTIVHYQAII